MPRHWGRLLDVAGLIVAAVAVPLWSATNPVVAVLLFAAGVTVMVIRPEAMLRRPRAWRRALVFIGAMACVTTVSLWTDVHPLVAVAGIASGLTIVGLGSLLAPSIDTGAHVARSMENTALGGEVVVPPKSLIDRFDD